MLAAAPVPVESLPAHRVALRAALGAVAGCLASGLVALPLVALSGDDQPGFLMFIAVGGGAAVMPSFVVAVELARRLPAELRLAALAALGALSPAFVICSLIWAVELTEGHGAERAWREIMRWLAMVVNRPGKSLPGAAAVLIPFALASASHAGGLPGALGRLPALPARVALAAIAGAAACGIAWLGYAPGPGDRVLFAAFALLPPALEVAITLALPVESRLLTWWAKRRDAA